MKLRMACVAALAACALVAPSFAGLRPWTIDDILALRTASDPRVSPDGSKIVYVVNALAPDSASYQSDLWLGDVATGTQRRLTTATADDDTPRWSPDGRSIAFLSAREGAGQTPGRQVWSLSLEGGEATALTAAAGGVSRYEWFADGRSLAYLSRDGKSAAVRAREAQHDDSWVASENRVLQQLWVIDLSTRKATQLTNADLQVTSFAVSPDGKRIAYAAQKEPRWQGQYDSDLWMVPVAGGKSTPLVQQLGMDHRPVFSPDGRWVAFVSQCGRDREWASRTSLCIIAAAGGSPVEITPKFDERIGGAGIGSEPTWLPDNESLFFVTDSRTDVRIFRAFTDDRPVEPVTRESGVNDWPSMDSAGKVLAWTHESSDQPGEVWVWELEKSAPRAFTDLNPQTRDRLAFPSQVVTWAGADGQQVEGLLLSPVGVRPGVRTPLLLQVHGGPAATHAKYYTPLCEGIALPLYLQKGWAVLMPNPRGSAGYGDAWRTATRRDWGGKDYEDLMRGVDAMIRLGLADSTKLAVSGWSYGGFMTANIVTRTSRFRAAVMSAGVSNMTSFVGTADVPYMLGSTMGAWPWEDPAVYVEHSPLFHAGAVTTPTAVLHGSEDGRVPTSQGWEFYNALHTRGVPTDLMLLPREEHGPVEPRHVRAMMQWQYDWMMRWTLAPTPAAKPASPTRPR